MGGVSLQGFLRAGSYELKMARRMKKKTLGAIAFALLISSSFNLGTVEAEETSPSLAVNLPSQGNSNAVSGTSFILPHGEQGERRELALKQLYVKPWPTSGIALYVAIMYGGYWTGHPDPANQAAKDLAAYFYKEDAAEKAAASAGRDYAAMEFHWQAYQIERLIFLFGKNGIYRPGRMSPEAEQTLKKVLWSWTSDRAGRVLFNPANDWKVWGSENHHLMNWFSLWGAFQLLAEDPAYAKKTFADGSSLPELKVAADAYFKRWIQNRATRGLLVECNSPGYAKYSFGGIYNFVDFSDDPELRRLAREFLDLYWTEWALEEIQGVRGGSRHRSYPGQTTLSGSASELAGYHFGKLVSPEPNLHPSALCTMTSSYEPPSFVREIVKHREELGAYEINSRLPGHLDPHRPARFNYFPDPKHPLFEPQGAYCLDPECRSMLRKTYVTPDFALGTTMVAPLDTKEWASISAQNRWDGVIFKDDKPIAAGHLIPYLFLQPAIPAKGSMYNTEWSVMDKGVLMIQRLKQATPPGNQQIWFSLDLLHVEREGWIFVEAPHAYAAVKVVNGGYAWEKDRAELWRNLNQFNPKYGSELLIPKNSLSTIILEVSSKKGYADFTSFQNEILHNRFSTSTTRIDYSSSHYQNTLTFFPDQSKMPLINGKTVVLENPKSFSGGVLDADFGGKTVRLMAFGLEHLFRF